jgi:tetratricopeptide (TPR) repeat protein
MISRFKTLLLGIFVVSIAIYIVLLNSAYVTIYLDPSSPIHAHVGIIILVSFALGLISMSIVALGVGFRYYLRERNLLAQNRESKTFYQQMLKARSLQSTGELEKAREAWEKAVKKDPSEVIARVELAKVLKALSQKGLANSLDSLRVLDAARAIDSKNPEILINASDINLDLNNQTAALDNLALIAFQQPNQYILEKARDIAEKLGRIPDALEYQKKLIDLIGSDESEVQEVGIRLNYKLLLAENEKDQHLLKDALKNFLKKHGDYAPALERLSNLEKKSGRIDEAAQLLAKAAKVSNEIKYWHSAARLWIKSHNPDKAIAAARNATNETKGLPRVAAEIELLRVYIALGMLEQARQLCDGLPFLLKREAVSMPTSLYHTFLSLKGLCLCRMGEYRQTADTLRKLCDDDPEMHELMQDTEDDKKNDAPSPRLSTP